MIQFKQYIAEAISKATEIKKEELEGYIEVPKDDNNGDFAFPCFKLAKTMKKAPQIIAEEIKLKIEIDTNIVDKIEVLLTLLLVQIVKDMLNADFNKKYIFFLPESLYTKTNKLDKIFNLFADEYAKNNIIVLTQYEELSKNKKVIKTLIKDGYKFAVDLKASKVNTKDQGVIEAMEYIFIDKRVKGKMFESIDVLSSIKEELHNKIAYDDIASKVGSYWGN